MSPRLEQQIEAILFVASEPLSLQQLAVATQTSETATKQALEELTSRLTGRGIRLQHTGNRYNLVTAPSAGSIIERFLGAQARSELTKQALETLAIIAYKQPITRNGVEAIRGVSCEQTIRNLLSRGLIVEDHQPDPTTRARRYITSQRFLQHFGFTHPNEIPKLEDLEPKPAA